MKQQKGLYIFKRNVEDLAVAKEYLKDKDIEVCDVIPESNTTVFKIDDDTFLFISEDRNLLLKENVESCHFATLHSNSIKESHITEFGRTFCALARERSTRILITDNRIYNLTLLQ